MCVRKIVLENPQEGPNRADILIFMPGMAEIKETWKGLHALNRELVEAGIPPVYPLRLDSRSVAAKTHEYLVAIILPLVGQTVLVDRKPYQPSRRVIISTNIAETGLTLDDLKYVIDAGYNKEIEYNPVLGVTSLLSKPAPQSRITQRMGRAGRKFPGVFYPLYTRETLQALPEIQLPQILLNDISPVFLDMVAEQVRAKKLAAGEGPIVRASARAAPPDPPPAFRIEDIDMIDAPNVDALQESLELHVALGFLERHGHWLTPMGELAAKFTNQDPRIIRMLLASFYWRVSPMDIISIIAYISAGDRTLTVEPVEGADDTPEAALEATSRVSLDWPKIYLKAFEHMSGRDSAKKDKSKDKSKDGSSEKANNLYMLLRVLAADDFINGVILFSALTKFRSHQAIEKWCVGVNLSYRAALAFVGARETFIEQAMTWGLHVMITGRPLLCDSSPEDLVDIVARIKHCIYDGFRLNLLTRRGGQYYTESGLLVAPPRMIAENIASDKKYKQGDLSRVNKLAPRYLVYNRLTMSQNPTTKKYTVGCDMVSAMDSFVSCDSEFML